MTVVGRVGAALPRRRLMVPRRAHPEARRARSPLATRFKESARVTAEAGVLWRARRHGARRCFGF